MVVGVKYTKLDNRRGFADPTSHYNIFFNMNKMYYFYVGEKRKTEPPIRIKKKCLVFNKLQ